MAESSDITMDLPVPCRPSTPTTSTSVWSRRYYMRKVKQTERSTPAHADVALGTGEDRNG